jgi:hypothetical protein
MSTVKYEELGIEPNKNGEIVDPGIIVEGEHGGKGKKSTSSSDTNEFTPAEPLDAFTKMVNNGARPKCAATNRPHPPATHTIDFTNHPKFGTANNIPLCDFHFDQYKHDPEGGTISKLGVSEEANNDLRRREYIRKFNAKNEAAKEIFNNPRSSLETRNLVPVPVVQTSGRPKPKGDSSKSLISSSSKDRKKAKKLLEENVTEVNFNDPVTPVINDAVEHGGRTPDPYAWLHEKDDELY